MRSLGSPSPSRAPCRLTRGEAERRGWAPARARVHSAERPAQAPGRDALEPSQHTLRAERLWIFLPGTAALCAGSARAAPSQACGQSNVQRVSLLVGMLGGAPAWLPG